MEYDLLLVRWLCLVPEMDLRDVGSDARAEKSRRGELLKRVVGRVFEGVDMLGSVLLQLR